MLQALESTGDLGLMLKGLSRGGGDVEGIEAGAEGLEKVGLNRGRMLRATNPMLEIPLVRLSPARWHVLVVGPAGERPVAGVGRRVYPRAQEQKTTPNPKSILVALDGEISEGPIGRCVLVSILDPETKTRYLPCVPVEVFIRCTSGAQFLRNQS